MRLDSFKKMDIVYSTNSYKKMSNNEINPDKIEDTSFILSENCQDSVISYKKSVSDNNNSYISNNSNNFMSDNIY